MSDKTYNYLKYTALIEIVSIFCYYAFQYVVPLFVPFTIAYAAARLVRPVSNKIRYLCPTLDKPVTVLFVLLLTAGIILVSRIIVSALIDQFIGFFTVLSEKLSSPDVFFGELNDRFKTLSAEHPFINRIISGFTKENGLIENLFKDFVEKAGSAATDAAGAIISKMPSAIISLFVTVSAAFYFSLDRGETESFLSRILPNRIFSLFEKLKKNAAAAVSSYFKTYALLMLLVFSIMFAGLSILGVEYSLAKAVLIAIVDLLPILGAGAVLGPWAVIEALLGNTSLAIWISVLLVVVTVARNIAEPKIMGDRIGVPPVVALISVYVGMKLLGVMGIILFPIIISVVNSVVSENEKTPTEVGVKKDKMIIISER